MTKYQTAFLIISIVFLTACNLENLEQSVEVAVETVESSATTNAETQNTSDPEEDNTSTPTPDKPYDVTVYGDIDSLDVNGVEVTFWHQHTNLREQELNALIDEFNAINPYGIIVNGSFEGGYGSIYDKMITGLTTGDLPSIVVAYQNQAAAYQAANGLVSLDPYINHPQYGLSTEERNDFFQSFLASDRLPQFEGESFGFPPNRSMEVMYYNQTWLEELGYSAPPQTPEEFQQIACAATDTEAGTFGYAISTDASRVASFIFARGGDIFDYENKRFTYNTPEAISALTMMQELYQNDCAILISDRDGDEIDFANRKVLFTIGTSSDIPAYQNRIQNSNASFEWSVAPIPYTGSEPVQNIYGASVSIPKTTPEEQLAAWLFLKYFTTPEVQARWAQASNYFPVRESVAEGLDDYFAVNPAYQTAFDLLQYGKTEAPVAGYDNVRDEVSEAYSRILEGEDVAMVLAELDERANEILAESAP